MQLSDESLDRQNLRVSPSGRVQPMPVQIEAQVRAAVVSVHYAYSAREGFETNGGMFVATGARERGCKLNQRLHHNFTTASIKLLENSVGSFSQ